MINQVSWNVDSIIHLEGSQDFFRIVTRILSNSKLSATSKFTLFLGIIKKSRVKNENCFPGE